MESTTWDVVVIGLGGAGAVSALSAAEAGAQVVVVEKEAHGGGNTQEAGGSLRLIADAAVAVDHFAALARGQTPREVIEAFVEGCNPAIEWLQDSLRLRTTDAGGPWHGWVYPFVAHNPFPGVPGVDGLGDRVRIEQTVPGHGGAALWEGIVKAVRDRGIEVRYRTAARELIRDASGRVTGVLADHGGDRMELRATKGVVLACGGFSWDRRLQQEFLGVELPAFGFPGRNNGDGVRMAQAVGAQLWHMTAVATVLGYQIQEFPSAFRHHVYNESFIYVDQNGQRFVNELGLDNHSLPWAFRVMDPTLPGYPRMPGYFIFDESARLAGPIVKDALGHHRREWEWSKDNAREVKRGWIAEAEDAGELADQLGLPPAQLRTTVERYNEHARSGIDSDCGRAAEKMTVLKPPFYGIALWPCLLNTQGGPRRGPRCEVIDYRDRSIPGLFAAGELGSIWTDLYPGGGNLIEAIVSGRIAGRAAAVG
jgi:succinate dehydrogenase/fumarate reductase flavoprotein subunit